MASSRGEERLSGAETMFLRLAVREGKPAVYFILKYCDAIGMRVHHRLLVGCIVDSENAHLLIFELNSVVLWVNCNGVLLRTAEVSELLT